MIVVKKLVLLLLLVLVFISLFIWTRHLPGMGDVFEPDYQYLEQDLVHSEQRFILAASHIRIKPSDSAVFPAAFRNDFNSPASFVATAVMDCVNICPVIRMLQDPYFLQPTQIQSFSVVISVPNDVPRGNYAYRIEIYSNETLYASTLASITVK